MVSKVIRFSKKDASRFLSRVPEDKAFRCADSCVIYDLRELAKALDNMSEETFRYHANDQKNDFANWVSDVIGDRELASNLRKVANKPRATEMVSNRVSFLSRKA